MAKRKKVVDVARQRGTSVDDVLARLKRVGVDGIDAQAEVDEADVERAYAAPQGQPAVNRPSGARPGGAGKRRRVVIDAGASRRGPGPQLTGATGAAGAARPSRPRSAPRRSLPGRSRCPRGRT